MAQWLDAFRLDPAQASTLQDRWLAALSEFEEPYHAWTCDVFLDWGRVTLPDLIADFVDGEAEKLAEDHFYDLINELPRACQLMQLQRIKNYIRRLQALPPEASRPHRPVRLGPVGGKTLHVTTESVTSHFRDHAEWQDDLRGVRWIDLPREQAPPALQIPGQPSERRLFVFAHLFSGRRRRGDFHFFLDSWAAQHQVDLLILSLDTAVDFDVGNLMLRSETWTRLAPLYKKGCITGTLTGTPCETFSEARFTEPPEDWEGPPWPRPLRSSERLYGLPHISNKELRQCWCGSTFFLQACFAASCHLTQGGYMLGEHPAIPSKPERPSTWTSAIMTIFKKHPSVKLHHINQYLFGAHSVKPTGVLAVNLPHCRRDLYHKANFDLVKPAVCAIGTDSSGKFRTACLKEYPEGFSSALAHCMTSQLAADLRSTSWRLAEIDEEEYRWLSKAAAGSATINEKSTWLPDYQGR